MDRNKAATVIQAYCRGYLARREYARELLQLFEMEEEERREKELLQVWEGEILLERHRLLHEIYDNKTLSNNEQRKLNTMATRIQRAWRHKKCTNGSSHHNADVRSHSNATALPSDSSNVNKASLFANNGPLQTQSGELDRNTAQDVPYTRRDSQTSSINDNDHSQHTSHGNKLSTQHNIEDNEHTHWSTRDTLGARDTSSIHDIETSHEGNVIWSSNGKMETRASNTVSTTGIFSQLTRDDLGGSDLSMEDDYTKDMLTYKQHSSTMFQDLDSLPNSFDTIPGHNHKSIDHDSPSRSVTGNRYQLCYTLELSDSSTEDLRDSMLTPAPVEHGHSYSNAQDGNNLTLAHLNDIVSKEASLPTLSAPLEFGRQQSHELAEDVELHLGWNNDTLDFHSELHVDNDDCSDSAIRVSGEVCGIDSSSSESEPRDTHTHHSSVCHDHSNSPLHGMKAQQLVKLILFLETKLDMLSKTLVTQLEEREILRNQNKLLHTNIERLTRRVQQIYIPSQKSLKPST